MSKKADNEKLERLHDAIAEAFLKAIAAGEPPASLLKEAREFLKDNSITGAATPNSNLGKLAERVPFPSDPLQH